MDWVRAYRIAEQYCALLEPGCKRIHIAGSVRRKKPEVDDIELVAEPNFAPVFNLFGDQVGERNLLHELLDALQADGQLTLDDQVRRDGLRYKRFAHMDHGAMRAISIDLFIVTPPAQWGVIFALRTGPADYSHWLVTQRSKGGAMPAEAYCKDGAIWYDDIPLPMVDEREFFTFLDLEYIEPEKRRPTWYKFNAEKVYGSRP